MELRGRQCIAITSFNYLLPPTAFVCVQPLVHAKNMMTNLPLKSLQPFFLNLLETSTSYLGASLLSNGCVWNMGN